MITSRQNEKIKLIRSLIDKKARDNLNLYIAEGVKTVKTAMSLSADIDCIVATPKGLELMGLSEKDALLVSEEVFSCISGEVTPQGVLALIKKPNSPIRPPKGKCLLLDCVADPANVGAIIRTAVASGYNDIYLVKGSADAFSPKSVRASMSGIFSVNIFEGERQKIIDIIDCPIYVTDMQGENVFKFIPSKKYCVVIGNEANGVSKTLIEKADGVLTIPMNDKMESLNAGVSAGIVMYALNNNKGE